MLSSSKDLIILFVRPGTGVWGCVLIHEKVAIRLQHTWKPSLCLWMSSNYTLQQGFARKHSRGMPTCEQIRRGRIERLEESAMQARRNVLNQRRMSSGKLKKDQSRAPQGISLLTCKASHTRSPNPPIWSRLYTIQDDQEALVSYELGEIDYEMGYDFNEAEDLACFYCLRGTLDTFQNSNDIYCPDCNLNIIDCGSSPEVTSPQRELKRCTAITYHSILQNTPPQKKRYTGSYRITSWITSKPTSRWRRCFLLIITNHNNRKHNSYYSCPSLP